MRLMSSLLEKEWEGLRNLQTLHLIWLYQRPFSGTVKMLRPLCYQILVAR